MADPCKTLSADRPLHLSATCIKGGCDDIEDELKWQMGQSDDPDAYVKDDWKVYYDSATGTYVFEQSGAKNPLTFRCDPTFRAVALGVRVDDGDCLYDVELTQE